MSTFTRAGRLLVLSAGLLAPAAQAGNVLVVDTGGPALFHQIQPAVDAALDGDTVLVKSGTYSGFSIVDKRLSVVADAGHSVIVSGTVQVTNVAISRDVVLAGLRVNGSGHGLLLLNDAGSVRVQGCALNGNDFGGISLYGAQVVGCDDVAFASCVLQGALDAHWSGAGLSMTGSHTAVYDCVLRGGQGFDGDCYLADDGGDGGAGAIAIDSFLFASGSTFSGGSGGDAPYGGCSSFNDGGDGATGLHLQGSVTTANVLQCTFTGGHGGIYSCTLGGCGQMGQTAPPTYVTAGASLTTLLGTSRKLVAPRVVRESPATIPLTIQGQAGDLVFLLISRQAAFKYVPSQAGVLLSPQSPPPAVLNLGVIPAGGVLSLSIPSYDLGAGVQSRTYFLQTLHRLPNGSRVLGSPGSLAVLDSAF